mmetsp:Transcript_25734/g.59379  ORF Transcript_25734/g.59379 Transcript_25734/m.59379 type:complete len:230 (-) Transcript_25734:416-1105(-)
MGTAPFKQGVIELIVSHPHKVMRKDGPALIQRLIGSVTHGLRCRQDLMALPGCEDVCHCECARHVRDIHTRGHRSWVEHDSAWGGSVDGQVVKVRGASLGRFLLPDNREFGFEVLLGLVIGRHCSRGGFVLSSVAERNGRPRWMYVDNIRTPFGIINTIFCGHQARSCRAKNRVQSHQGHTIVGTCGIATAHPPHQGTQLGDATLPTHLLEQQKSFSPTSLGEGIRDSS